MWIVQEDGAKGSIQRRVYTEFCAWWNGQLDFPLQMYRAKICPEVKGLGKVADAEYTPLSKMMLQFLLLSCTFCGSQETSSFPTQYLHVNTSIQSNALIVYCYGSGGFFFKEITGNYLKKSKNILFFQYPRFLQIPINKNHFHVCIYLYFTAP